MNFPCRCVHSIALSCERKLFFRTCHWIIHSSSFGYVLPFHKLGSCLQNPSLFHSFLFSTLWFPHSIQNRDDYTQEKRWYDKKMTIKKLWKTLKMPETKKWKRENRRSVVFLELDIACWEKNVRLCIRISWTQKGIFLSNPWIPLIVSMQTVITRNSLNKSSQHLHVPIALDHIGICEECHGLSGRGIRSSSTEENDYY